MVAAPLLRPILAETRDYAKNLRLSSRRTGQPKEWAVACMEKADSLDALCITIETAFGCFEFDARGRVVPHYK